MECRFVLGELSSIGRYPFCLSLARLPRPAFVCLARVVSLLAFDSALFKDHPGVATWVSPFGV
jgi:hypothetical protein